MDLKVPVQTAPRLPEAVAEEVFVDVGVIVRVVLLLADSEEDFVMLKDAAGTASTGANTVQITRRPFILVKGEVSARWSYTSTTSTGTEQTLRIKQPGPGLAARPLDESAAVAVCSRGCGALR